MDTEESFLDESVENTFEESKYETCEEAQSEEETMDTGVMSPQGGPASADDEAIESPDASYHMAGQESPDGSARGSAGEDNLMETGEINEVVDVPVLPSGQETSGPPVEKESPSSPMSMGDTYEEARTPTTPIHDSDFNLDESAKETEEGELAETDMFQSFSYGGVEGSPRSEVDTEDELSTPVDESKEEEPGSAEGQDESKQETPGDETKEDTPGDESKEDRHESAWTPQGESEEEAVGNVGTLGQDSKAEGLSPGDDSKEEAFGSSRADSQLDLDFADTGQVSQERERALSNSSYSSTEKDQTVSSSYDNNELQDFDIYSSLAETGISQKPEGALQSRESEKDTFKGNEDELEEGEEVSSHGEHVEMTELSPFTNDKNTEVSAAEKESRSQGLDSDVKKDDRYKDHALDNEEDSGEILSGSEQDPDEISHGDFQSSEYTFKEKTDIYEGASSRQGQSHTNAVKGNEYNMVKGSKNNGVVENGLEDGEENIGGDTESGEAPKNDEGPSGGGLSLSKSSLHDDHGELDYDEEVDEVTDTQRRISSDDVKPDEEEGERPDSKMEEREDGEDADNDDDEDDGELQDDDDCEEGEIKDPDGKRPFTRPLCRFFTRGHCTWGSSCRFLHPGVNDKGNYSMIDHPGMMRGPPGMGLGGPGSRGGPRGHWRRDMGPPLEADLPPPPEEPPTESAWERGLRQAKELRKKASQRKENETNFEEKRLNLTIEEDRDFNKENDQRRFFANTPTNYKDPYYDQHYEDDYPEKVEPWHGGHYENFEVRWNRQPPPPPQQPDYPLYPPPQPERERPRDRPRERGRYKSPPQEPRFERRPKEKFDRYPEWNDRTEPPASDRPPKPQHQKRGDEWTDPWRRSKSPKTRRRDSSSRSRSRGRRRKRSYSRGSYSSSYSSRSSRSRSSSYSSYSSRSSYSRSSSYSSRSSSRSRSRTSSPRKKNANKTGAPPGGRPGNKRPPNAPPAKPSDPPRSAVMVKGPPAPNTTKRKKPGPVQAALPQKPPAPPGDRGRKREREPPRRPIKRSSSFSSSGSSRSRSRSFSSSRSRSSSVSSRSSVSSSSSSSSSGSADSEHLYRDMASPASSKSSRSPSPRVKPDGKPQRHYRTRPDAKKGGSRSKAPPGAKPPGGKVPGAVKAGGPVKPGTPSKVAAKAGPPSRGVGAPARAPVAGKMGPPAKGSTAAPGKTPSPTKPVASPKPGAPGKATAAGKTGIPMKAPSVPAKAPGIPVKAPVPGKNAAPGKTASPVKPAAPGKTGGPVQKAVTSKNPPAKGPAPTRTTPTTKAGKSEEKPQGGPGTTEPRAKSSTPANTAKKDPLKVHMESKKPSIKLTLINKPSERPTAATTAAAKKRPAEGAAAQEPATKRPVKMPQKPTVAEREHKVSLKLKAETKLVKPVVAKPKVEAKIPAKPAETRKPEVLAAPKVPKPAVVPPPPVAVAPAAAAVVKSKKSTSSRREELLKQLKAVEDAIARKRAKMS